MSDFDKEAEKEKLRKKLEEEQEEREQTQRMSDLLLKGATMTNRHCDACGDPIFRYEGQAFCPTCQTEVEAAPDESESADGTDAASSTADPADAAPQGSASAEHGVEPQSDADGSETASESPDSSAVAGAPGDERLSPDPDREPRPERTPQDRPETIDRSRSVSPTAGSDGTVPEGSDATSRSPDTAPGDIDEARATLVRTLTDLARRAERTEDPRKARELLGAAREAAEALSALETTR